MPRFQFSLSTLLWITLAVACWFGGMRFERWLVERRAREVPLQAIERRAMRRPQFRLRTLFIVTALIGATIAFGGPSWHYIYEPFPDGARAAILLWSLLILAYVWDRWRR